ncbi:MAG: UbiD family decarboxylase [Candidatus Altiarchaeota archaeon]
MTFRELIKELEKNNELLKIKEAVSTNLEIAKILSNEKKAVLFENVKNSNYKVVGNLLSSERMLRYLKLKERQEFLKRISNAINNPSKPKIVERAPCHEVVIDDVNLYDLPILLHTSKDMGPYITAGVFIANDKEYGLNASFHRATPIAKDKLVARICKRDLYTYLQRTKKDLNVAICIGLSPAILISAAISVAINTNELEIANSIENFNLVKCKTSEILVPSESEIVLEGRITKEKHFEGPFLDITGTFDIIRKEPVIEIDLITHRKNPIYHAIVPSLKEHKFLMGTPREVAMFNEINKVCRCEDVLLTEGGCSWLNGVVKIKKKNKDDGKKAIVRSFEAHKSLKHVVIVDDDIDIHNINEVEWAIATRFQGKKENLVIKKELGSSLDPSADENSMTVKIGIDATIPWNKKKEDFIKGRIGE